MSGLGNQGGGPQKQASKSQVTKATTGGANTPGTINSGNGAGGGTMGAVKQERPPASDKSGGLGN